MTSCFAYKVIRDLESIDHLFINPICRIGLINKQSFDSRYLKWSVHIVLYLAIVNKIHVNVTFGWHYSSMALREFVERTLLTHWSSELVTRRSGRHSHHKDPDKHAFGILIFGLVQFFTGINRISQCKHRLP